MSCRELRPFWPMFLDGELTEKDADPYIRHLEECTSCRGLVEGERRFRQVFRSKAKSREQVPAQLRDRVEGLTHATRRRPFHMLAGSMALASLALFTWTTQTAFSPVLASVAEKHRQGLPLDLSTHDSHEAQQFVQRHVPKLKLPHFSNDEMQLAGARLVDFPGHHGAMVRYIVGPKAQSVSVAVYRSDDRERLELPHTIDVGEHHVFFDRVGNLEAAVWQCQGMVYSMVSELDRDSMRHMLAFVE